MCDVRPFDICDVPLVGRVTTLRLFGRRADTPAVAAVVPALDGTEHGLDPRLRKAWTLAAAAGALLAGIAGAVIAVLVDGPAWLALLLVAAGVVLAVAGAVGARLEWASYRYRVTDDAVEITHGVIVQTLSVLPHRRIQQIDVRRGPSSAASASRRSCCAAPRPPRTRPPRVGRRRRRRPARALLARAGLGDAV